MRLRLVSIAIIFCALAVGGSLLHMSAGSISAAPAPAIQNTAEIETVPGDAWQSTGEEADEQSMLAPMIISFFALTILITNFYLRRRSRDNDT